MLEAFSAEQIRAAEAPLLTARVPLMERAAFALSLEVVRLLRADSKVRGGRVLLLIGAGNNGGDGLYSGAYLARRGVSVTAVMCSTSVHPGGLGALQSAGGEVLALEDADLAQLVCASSVVVDALLGIGARGALRGDPAIAVAQVISALDGLSAPSRPRIVAADIPSGINLDDGEVPGPVIAADLTVTFGANKSGLLLPPAALLAGRVTVVDIGINPSQPQWRRMGSEAVASQLWPATASDHKYRRGVVELTVGSQQYPGAASLAVAGALGSGAGAVRFSGPEELRSNLVARHPEILLGAGRRDALVLGCGVPNDLAPPLHEEYLRMVLEALREEIPVVLDAGGLQLIPALLARREGSALPGSVILTPHAAEIGFLVQKLAPEQQIDPVAQPALAVDTLRHLTGATVMLKGAITVIQGTSRWAQGPNNPWLATAGSGDVLAGLLGGLLATAQKRQPEWPGNPDNRSQLDPAAVAAAAVFLHSAASERANPHGPVTASQVAQAVPQLWAEVTAGVVGQK